MWILLLMLGLSSALLAEPFVQAAEFPYSQFPKTLWERELVWLKNIGIQTVEFSVPQPWSETDLTNFLRMVRRAGLQAWVQAPAGEQVAQLEAALDPLLTKHGGPIRFVKGGAIANGAAPPVLVHKISATEPDALARSHEALASGRGCLLWQDVEDLAYPRFRKGVISFTGEERAGAAALRRAGALLKGWSAVLPNLQPRGVAGKFPAGVTATQMVSFTASAIRVTNRGEQAFRGDLQAYDPSTKRTLKLPSVRVPKGESLWLPVNVALASSGLCEDCAVFAKQDRLVYATAELQSIEFENGILAMEFAAPVEAEAVVQLSRRPHGPFLAGGRPLEFDWDERASLARLKIPAGKGPIHRVRIGLAIEPPDESAFFATPVRLIIGQTNRISTSYSSEELAGRSRLRGPADFRLKPILKSPAEIDYEVSVPADALHGTFVQFALEADGIRLARARLQLFRPASLRLKDAVSLHYGSESELLIDPPLVSGKDISVAIRNNFAAIQNYVLQASGAGLDLSPPKTEISIAATAEREVSFHVFNDQLTPGIHEGRLKLSGAADRELAFRYLALPRGQALAYSLDLDGDGAPEWVLENEKLRAVFSGRDGGRWLEFVWKENNRNVLPAQGALAGAGPVQVRCINNGSDARLEFSMGQRRRIVRLDGSATQLAIEQDSAIPDGAVIAENTAEVAMRISRQAANQMICTLERTRVQR